MEKITITSLLYLSLNLKFRTRDSQIIIVVIIIFSNHKFHKIQTKYYILNLSKQIIKSRSPKIMTNHNHSQKFIC